MKKRILSLSLLFLALRWEHRAPEPHLQPPCRYRMSLWRPMIRRIMPAGDSGCLRQRACEVVETGDGSLEDTLRALASQDGVALVQPNYVYEDTSTAGNDPLFSRQWALSNDGTLINLADHTSAVAGIDIHAEEAWKIYGEGKRDVVIALIDTGVEITHPRAGGFHLG